MIFWRGLGLPLAIGAVVLTMGLTALLQKSPSFAQNSEWPGIIGAAIASLALCCVGFWLNKREKNKARELIDQSTGEKVIVMNSHDLFFIPIQYVGAIYFIAQVVKSVVQIIHS